MARKPRRNWETLRPTPLNETAQERAVANLQLAYRLAWKRYRSCARTVPLDELYGEALYALTYAAGRFDRQRGVPFGAYATLAIEHRLINLINLSRRGHPRMHIRFSDLVPQETIGVNNDLFAARQPEHVEEIATRDFLEQMRRLVPHRCFVALYLHHALGHSLGEVGAHLGVSRERVRQLLNKTIKRLRQRLSNPFPDGEAGHPPCER